MYCPSCSTQSIEGAKFCKTCGMNLNVLSQALSGGVVVSDPLREREYKRARKQISDGIQGAAVGTALLTASALSFFLGRTNTIIYAVSLVIGLAGIVKLFRSIGSIIDSKVGPKLLDPELQPRSTGGLPSLQSMTPQQPAVNGTQRLARDPSKPAPQLASTRPVNLPKPGEAQPQASQPEPPQKAEPPQKTEPPQKAEPPARIGTGRVNREHSSPLRKLDQEDELMLRIRN